VDGTEWDIDGTDITYTYPWGTTEGPRTPTITLSPGATVNPSAGDAQNFFTAAGVSYTVTAEDGTTAKTYTVKATVKVFNKYETRDWTVVTRNNHGWGDGSGSQTLWSGGHPMLIVDDDPASGWHAQLWQPFPHVVVIDMKNSNPIGMIHADGCDYLHKVQIYLTDALPYSGYTSHTVDWDDENNRSGYYYDWLTLMRNLMPSGDNLPLPSWGAPVVDETLPVNNTFTFTFEENVQGRYLILLFPDNDSNGGNTYLSIKNLEVYYAE
jgi:hypothetical protein